jgi:uncharacterized lipoprotein YmbA
MKYFTIFLTILTTGCGVLQPVKDLAVNHLLDPLVPARTITGTSPAIAISRPSLPSYLDRQQLVSRSADGQAHLHSDHLWAEPLDAGIARVTALNLGRLVNSLNIQPVETFVALEYQHLLEIRVSRFEADAGGNVALECTWKLQPVSGKVTNPRPFSTVIPGSGAAQPAGNQNISVAAMNEALARLAREIAGTL